MKRISDNLRNALIYTIEHPEVSYHKIGEKFNVGRGTIARNLGKNWRDYNIQGIDGNWYLVDKNLLAAVEYYINNSHVYITDVLEKFQLKIGSDTFVRNLKVLGYTYEKHYRYSNNRNAFSEIKTEEDAYWLGFITADGYINEKNNWLSICIGQKDLEHLKKFCRYLGYKEDEILEVIKQGYGGAYTRDNIIYRLIIPGKQMVENLKQYHLFQKKSEKEVPYKCRTIELEKAYIRGLIDGDGYICSNRIGIGLVGSYPVLEYVREVFSRALGLDKNRNIQTHGTIFRLCYHSKDAFRLILDFLYKDSKIYLDRKYALYNVWWPCLNPGKNLEPLNGQSEVKDERSSSSRNAQKVKRYNPSTRPGHPFG